MNDIIRLERKKQDIKAELKIHKRTDHIRFKNHKPGQFLLLDIIFFLCIFFNIGALVLTNALIVVNEPEIKLVEANPVASEQLGLPAPDTTTFRAFLVFILRGFFWVGLFFVYFYQRQQIYTQEQMTYLLALLGGFCFILALDFFNNFGYWLGKLAVGG